MRRIFLMASLVFFSLPSLAQTHGVEIEAGATFLGKTEVEMIGTNTITGASVTIEPSNNLSYTGSIGYLYNFHERFSVKLATTYTKYKTNVITASGATQSSSYEGDIIDLQLSGQFDISNNLSIRAGTSYPLSMLVKGAMDNTTTNVDEFALDDMSLGFNAAVGYNFTKSINLRLGYVLNLGENTKAGKNLKVKVTSNYFVFLVGYQF